MKNSVQVSNDLLRGIKSKCFLNEQLPVSYRNRKQYRQESSAVARKPRDAAVVLFGLKFADNIHYKFKSSQASKTSNPNIPAQNRI